MRALATLPSPPRLLHLYICVRECVFRERGVGKNSPGMKPHACAANDEYCGIINKGWSKRGWTAGECEHNERCEIKRGGEHCSRAVSRCDVSDETMDVPKYMEQKLFDRKVMRIQSAEYMTVCSRHSRAPPYCQLLAFQPIFPDKNHKQNQMRGKQIDGNVSICLAHI
jgi:hypothetical protein